MSLCLGQKACADLLGVSRRTVRYWDHGRSRVPWSAVRLLRILRAGELPSDHWPGWRVSGDRLITPAGVAFRAGEFTWWALTCLQARSWQRAYDRSVPARPSAAEGLPAGVAVVDGGALFSALVPAEPALAAVPCVSISVTPCPAGAGVAAAAERSEAAGGAPPAGLGLSPIENNAKAEQGNGVTAGFQAGASWHPTGAAHGREPGGDGPPQPSPPERGAVRPGRWA